MDPSTFEIVCDIETFGHRERSHYDNFWLSTESNNDVNSQYFVEQKDEDQGGEEKMTIRSYLHQV